MVLFGQELSGDSMKRKKRASDVAATPGPPAKSRLLEKSSMSPKTTSLFASASYDFDDRVTHQPLVPRVSELEVSGGSVLTFVCSILISSSAQP